VKKKKITGGQKDMSHVKYGANNADTLKVTFNRKL